MAWFPANVLTLEGIHAYPLTGADIIAEDWESGKPVTFGEVIESLRAGKRARNRSWAGPEDYIVMGDDGGRLKYVDPKGWAARCYTPSDGDIFATDWEIF